MRKVLKEELKVDASADDIWAVYSSHDLPRLIVQLLPTVFDKIEVVEGNGGLYSVLHVTFPSGSIPLSYKEKIVTMEDCKRLKEVRQIEGGYLEMGCTFYMDSFHILERGCDSCVIVSKTEYEVPHELAHKVEPYISIDSLANMATAISNFVLEENKKKNNSKSNCSDDDDDEGCWDGPPRQDRCRSPERGGPGGHGHDHDQEYRSDGSGSYDDDDGERFEDHHHGYGDCGHGHPRDEGPGHGHWRGDGGW